MDAVIRPAVPADLAAIDGILVRARRDAYRGQLADHELGLGRDGRAALELGLRRHARGEGVLLAAVVHGQLAGFVDAGPTADADDDSAIVGHVYAVYVDPKRWRAGIGRRLMEEAQAGLAAAGFREATLWVRDTNAGARAFYDALGWSVDSARKRTVIGGRVEISERRYRRALAGSAG